MLCRMHEKQRRIAAGFLSLLILAAVLFSAVFIAAEADHDCAGENCSVCVCIRCCAEFLSRLLPGVIAAVHTVLPALCVLSAALVFFALMTEETPVSRKVRLNN